MESCPVHSEQSIWIGWFLRQVISEGSYYTAQANIMDQGRIFVPSIMRGSIYTVDKNSVSMLAHFSPQHRVQPLVHPLAAYSIFLRLWESCVLTAASYSLWWGTNVIVLRLRSNSSQVRHLTAASYTGVFLRLWVFDRTLVPLQYFVCMDGTKKPTPPPPFLFYIIALFFCKHSFLFFLKCNYYFPTDHFDQRGDIDRHWCKCVCCWFLPCFHCSLTNEIIFFW